jgi:hypothetical protein
LLDTGQRFFVGHGCIPNGISLSQNVRQELKSFGLP